MTRRAKKDALDDAKAHRSLEDNAERQEKEPPHIHEAVYGDADEMRAIGEHTSGTQPDIGRKDKGVLNPRRRDRS